LSEPPTTWWLLLIPLAPLPPELDRSGSVVVVPPLTRNAWQHDVLPRDLAEVVDTGRCARAEAAHLPVVHQECLTVRQADDVAVPVDRACLAEAIGGVADSLFAQGHAQRAEVGHGAGGPAERLRWVGYARMRWRAASSGEGLRQVGAADDFAGRVDAEAAADPETQAPQVGHRVGRRRRRRRRRDRGGGDEAGNTPAEGQRERDGHDTKLHVCPLSPG